MPTATTIVVAREDFSIPGGDLSLEPDPTVGASGHETRFFSLLRDSKPDVVVLDLSNANGKGVDTILSIRRKSTVPILVICEENAPNSRDYRIAGAAECIAAPVDVMTLNQALQQIVRVTRTPETNASRETREPGTIAFGGLRFRPQQNIVLGDHGERIRLTSAENRLLSHLAANPWQVQSRAALAEALYGRHRPATDRAIDVVVNRLRKKLDPIGDSARDLIKTEFRRGYRFVSDVSAEA
ncbi:MAG TPA: response regulator transcription factor [Stellaceae bacterium]|jgi:DNA-binding response OmpR family regulator